MTKRIEALILTVSVVCMLTCQPVAAVTVTKQDGVSATASKLLTPGPLLDDFSKGTSVNLWGGATSVCAKSGTTASIAPSYLKGVAVPTTGSITPTGTCLQLTYDVSATDSWAAYVTFLGNASISSYNYLSFWVKGSTGNELLKIELHHANYDSSQAEGYNNNYKSAIYVTDYLDGIVSTSWKKVTIPLDAFVNITDRAQIKELVLTFENSQSSLNGSPTSGIVYISNISFGKEFLGYVKINNFSRKCATPQTGCAVNSTGGQSGVASWLGTCGSAIISPTQYVSYPRGLKFYFTGMSGGTDRWFSYYMIFGGGDTGWVESPHDFSAYSQLSFAVKGAVGDEYGIKVELNCSERATYYFAKNVIKTDLSWDTIKIDLANFKDSDSNGTPTGNSVNPATLKKCSFVYTYWLTAWGGKSTGTIYIDDVQFQISGYTADTTAPARPSSLTSATNGNIVTLTSVASSGTTDPSMENVRFEACINSVWTVIAYDYNTTDGLYSVKWDVSSLPAGKYIIRAVAMDAVGLESEERAALYTKT